MKYNRLMCAIEIKNGDFWQVALTPPQMDMVMDLIRQMHDGTIKVLHNKLAMEFLKPINKRIPEIKP